MTKQMQTEASKPLKRTRKLGPRRAQAKLETQEKIVFAARKLFVKNGYDASTLRQIAATAGIGLATVFSHVRDKRELIYLIFNHEIEEVMAKAYASLRPWQSFPEKILAITGPLLKLLAAEPVLARILLTESFLESPGPHCARYLELRDLGQKNIQAAVRAAVVRGEIQVGEGEDMLAAAITFFNAGIIRWWIAQPNPDWRNGLEQCERVLNIMMAGLRTEGKGSQPTRRVNRPAEKKSSSKTR